jgi:peroxiredoxin family protein
MEMEVSMFFTLWGLAAVKRKAQYQGKPLTEKMMAAVLPSGPHRVGTSRMNMLGLGPAFLRMMMGKKKVPSLRELIELAGEMEVSMVACEMSMGVMGIKREELIDGLEYGGVAAYLGDASDSKITLFI